MKYFIILFFIPSILLAQNINTELLGRWGEGACEAVEVDGTHLFMSNGSYIDIYDITANYTFISRIVTPGIVEDIVKNGNYVYVANGNQGLRIVDVSNVHYPFEISHVLPPGTTHRMKLHDSYLYTANYSDGLRVINIADPYNPVEISSFNNGSMVSSIDIQGDYIFLTQLNSWGIAIVNISDPNNPVFVKKIPIPSSSDVMIKDSVLYVTLGNFGGFLSISIKNPENPAIISVVSVIGDLLKIFNDYAYVLGGGYLQVVDISRPDSLSLTSSFYTASDHTALRFQDNFLFVASYVKLLIISVEDNSNPMIIGKIPSPSYTEDIVIENDIAYLSNNGLRVVDISNPANPKTIGKFQTEYGTDKICKKNNLAFLVDGNIGKIRIIGLDSIENPVEMSQITNNFNVNSMATYSDFLYVSNGVNLSIYNISDPYNPTFANSIPIQGYIDNILLKDSLLFTCQATEGLVIYSLSSPQNPLLLSATYSQPAIYKLTTVGNYIIGGNTSGAKVYDVSNPYSPIEKVSFSFDSYTYQLTAINNYLYANQGENGIKIINMVDINNPQVVGNFATPIGIGRIQAFGDKIFAADGRNGMPIIRNSLLTSISASTIKYPTNFTLFQNYPNPFNPTTFIRFNLPQASKVNLSVYNSLGELVNVLAFGEYEAGVYERVFDASGLASGIYIYILRTDNVVLKQKMVLMK